uniref:Large ribosomal subunit protein eL40 domain-containing protein n=1 Tax=Oryza punctata TaxID=4537 RepID=A0A0E0LKV4_ORYPU
MVDYHRRMGNMDWQHLGDAKSASFLHHVRELWKSPRGTVLRVEALALVAIVLSLFLAAFGSCRRWSNHWVIQKGFLAANAMFLSLGTYSIGLMQSSSVKSEMYPIWAVSLLALLCCVDSATTSSLDNKNLLWKMLYQLCLYFGYVVLMSISTISSDTGNIAICVLSAITLIKGIHMSMALVLPSSMRNMIIDIPNVVPQCSFGDPEQEAELVVDSDIDLIMDDREEVKMRDIASFQCEDGRLASGLSACKDVCLSFSLSHLLQRRFIGLSSIVEMKPGTGPLVKDCERAFKVVEIELAFLYDVLYTSNAFLHYYEAETASIWAFASVVAICFLGVVAIIPGTRSTRHAASPGSGTTVLDTTTADVIFTGVILVSLALLQVFQLLHCWTSNWARVAFACDLVRNKTRRWMKLNMKAFLIEINWFHNNYLWQNKLGQYSLADLIGSGYRRQLLVCCTQHRYMVIPILVLVCIVQIGLFLLKMLGLVYLCHDLREMLRGCSAGNPVELHADVKATIADFVSGIRCNEVSSWASSLVENGRSSGFPCYTRPPSEEDGYTCCILTWHIATCYCELAQQRDGKGFLEVQGDSERAAAVEKDHRAATTLSKYCAYLVISAPRLLPGRSEDTKRVCSRVRSQASSWPDLDSGDDDKLATMEGMIHDADEDIGGFVMASGVELGMGLRGMATPLRWKVMAEFWVKALVYAAPSDNVEEHMKHLSQGGELITHLWALLYHAGIDKWQLNPPQDDGEQVKAVVHPRLRVTLGHCRRLLHKRHHHGRLGAVRTEHTVAAGRVFEGIDRVLEIDARCRCYARLPFRSTNCRKKMCGHSNKVSLVISDLSGLNFSYCPIGLTLLEF